MQKTPSIKLAPSAKAGALAAGLAMFVASSASATVQTLNFSGYFGGGSVAPFPTVTVPAPFNQPTIAGSLSYDTNNSGVVTPENYSLPNGGSSAWYRNSITGFSFHSIGAAPASQITGSYSGVGAGQFVVYNNNGGLDALAPTIYSSNGLTGAAPSGYQLVAAGLYFFSDGRILGSNALPNITGTAAPFSAFLQNPPPGGYAGALFDATYHPLAGGSDVTIYASVNAVPEPSTWALMLLGFCGLGYASHRRMKKTAPHAA